MISDKRRKNKFMLVGEIFFNVAGMGILFTVIWFIFYRYNLETMFLYKKGTAILIFIYCVLYFMFTNIYGGHKVGYFRISELIYSQFLSMIIVNVIIWLQICLIDRRVVPIKPIVLLTALDTAFIMFWAVWSTKRFRKRNVVRNLLVICDDRLPNGIVEKMNWYDHKFRIWKQISISSGIEKIYEEAEKSDGLVLAEIDANLKMQFIQYGFEKNMPVFVIPNVSEIVLKNADTLNMCDMPVLICGKGELSLSDEFVKRLFDIVISVCVLFLLWPVMFVTAVLIKVYDNGPVLYKQKRLTIHGKMFTVYKFRSMVVDAEGDGVARLAKQKDGRITPVGRIIRKIRIDELPQLFNVIKGDMSIVGPRPERPEIAAQYEKAFPEFAYRLKVKAGLTGYAQVVGRYNTDPYDKLMWDLMYIESYSFLLDIKLILMTIKILFIPESTQGIEGGSTTAKSDRSERKESV
ncbi:MAG: exopolysaccharide biosynthesis polyprenyl glycosylphosphotransferase [Clostridia bacterium]|nr:exopolysaccharide biosynthesis polyprenyl glycosylphosphotransferase [Clostridia bacterium]MCI2001053.1 exopolysaccharide biosynthesis polyprenyl glycosylphosphotransferase [Clostridia bacterium]MCI2015652.1 exopolysaccharide biosynthesis polyprenyl glycosylphosphotransferase [Clostridia bacterium]